VSVLESVTGGFVPQISVAGAGILVFVSVVVFLLLIGRTSRILRPAPMSELCLREGRKTIARVHAEPFGEGIPRGRRTAAVHRRSSATRGGAG